MREIQSHKSFSRYKFQAIPMYKHVHCVHVHVHVHVITCISVFHLEGGALGFPP